MTRHYYLHWHGEKRFACGVTDAHNACDSKPTEYVTCEACRASEVFQEDLTVLEIGFSGDLAEWCMHMTRLHGYAKD